MNLFRIAAAMEFWHKSYSISIKFHVKDISLGISAVREDFSRCLKAQFGIMGISFEDFQIEKDQSYLYAMFMLNRCNFQNSFCI